MPAGFPSSFASAAAGNAADQSSRRSLHRGDSTGSSEWYVKPLCPLCALPVRARSRRARHRHLPDQLVSMLTPSSRARRPNGSTQTFRRPSLATSNSHLAHTRDGSGAAAPLPNPSTSTAYVPPHATSARNGSTHDVRYTRDQLLDIFKHHKAAGGFYDDPSELYIGEYEQDAAPSRWSRKDDPLPDPSTRPDACLNHAANTEPLGLVSMDAEERELFSGTVNSPIKAPNPGTAKEPGQREGIGARKMSLAHSHAAGGVSSPTGARPANRRRELSESFSRESIASPTTKTRPSLDEQEASLPPTLLRRRTDGREFGAPKPLEEDDADETNPASGVPFNLSRRISSGPLSAGLGGPQSPWAQPAGSAFGNFSHPNGSSSYSRRPAAALSRGESRFKGLMNRDGSDVARTSMLEKASFGSLAKSATGDERSDLSSENVPSGSAALGGAHEDDIHAHQQHGQGRGQMHFGNEHLSAGLAADDGSHDYAYHEQASRLQPGHGGEPLSPTFTNPYHSPERDPSRLDDMAADDIDFNNLHLPGLGSVQNEGFMSSGAGRMGSAFEPRPFERAQTFSPAVSRGFPGLGGLGGLPAVGSPTGWGTPVRERQLDGFGDAPFRHEASGHALQGLGSVGSFPSANRGNDRPGSMLGSSRLGSLFPSAMQEQIRGSDSVGFPRSGGLEGDRPEDTFETTDQRSSTHAQHRGGIPPRETESPYHASRGPDLSSPDTGSPALGNQRMETSQYPASKSRASEVMQQPGHSAVGTSGQPPAAQQKTMVMPDRIRWIYRDPQGNTQGPWSGLEMHDWYRAGFFSPELLVKKVEDADYEPLAQLIRRIGNSREPFLVPQIGIPGPPSSAAPTTWPGQVQQPQGSSNGAQPPFASSFPTFGTTLTAEQQNALERRKQEEQYLMARQKEHLAQQQVYHKMQMQNQALHGIHQQPLQHHSSAQSLQSQPSFGSMTSQQVFPGQHHGGSGQAQNQSGYDGNVRQSSGVAIGGTSGEGLGHIAEEDDMPRREDAQDDELELASKTALADRERLAREQLQFSKLETGSDQETFAGSERLDEFQALRLEAQPDENDEYFGVGTAQQQGKQAQAEGRPRDVADGKQKTHGTGDRSLTLTEQVQKAASAKKSPSTGPQSPWAKMDKPLAESHPASQTSSPLPAPAARRSGGQSVADALAADTASQRNSPAVETPTTSVAPWARESVETQKQPSLKEIQEAEARRAAKQEELATALRRAALEKESLAQQQMTAPAPGLPSSSTWASGDSIASPSATGAAPWSKTSASKSSAAPVSATKKTLQQIQKEEEALAKRQKAHAASAAASNGSGSGASLAAQSTSAGKRYADLASRSAATGSPTSSAWTTVGAGGKPKALPPGIITAAPAQLTRSASGSATTSLASAAKAKAPGSAQRTVSSSIAPSFNPQDDFKRWAVGELRGDLKKGILGKHNAQ